MKRQGILRHTTYYVSSAILAGAALLAASADSSAHGSEARPDTDADDVAVATAGEIVKADLPVATAADAFVSFPADVLDLLPKSTRLDMVEYAKVDSIYPATNSMGGISRLKKLTDDYALVEITPVSTIEIHILPYGKGRIVSAIYTIGGADREAADSDIRFYDENMTPMKRDRFISLPVTEDFFDLPRKGGPGKKNISEMIPFPTMSITGNPGSDTIGIKLTVGQYMNLEDFDNISRWLRQELNYRWDGKRYRKV